MEFKPAKNNELTAFFNGIYLHSAYNPQKEAERFVENLKIFEYEKNIILIEPALSYTASIIRNNFPHLRIGVIRFSKDFEKFNNLFDFVIKLYDINDNQFSDRLLNLIGEKDIFSTHFAEWTPSAKAFPDLYKKTISDIRNCMEKAKTLLVTREYFEKKWFINTLNFLKYLKNPVKLDKKIKRNVIIIASGPSSHENLKVIRKNQNKFFIICLSSAISVCKKNKIKIDLCMSTDGGFWAGEHLKHLDKNTIIAITPESYCKKTILMNNSILPMYYSDGVSKQILYFTEFNFSNAILAERNGTVSGTALDFALSNFEGKIFFSGLDMANQKGFQHEQPNEIEINNSLYDNRLHTKETRNFKSERNEGSLNIYLQWFQNKTLENNRVFRVINHPCNSLNMIKDITSKEFSDFCNQTTAVQTNSETKYFSTYEFNSNGLKKLTLNLTNFLDTAVLNQLFPLTSLSLSHNPENQEAKERLKDEKNRLLRKMGDICND